MSENMKIPIEQINKRRWSLIQRALSKIQHNIGNSIDANKLTIIETKNYLEFNYELSIDQHNDSRFCVYPFPNVQPVLQSILEKHKKDVQTYLKKRELSDELYKDLFSYYTSSSPEGYTPEKETQWIGNKIDEIFNDGSELSNTISIQYPEFLDSNTSFDDILNNKKILFNKIESQESVLTLPILINLLKSLDVLDRTFELTIFCAPKMVAIFRMFNYGTRPISEVSYNKIGCFLEVFGMLVVLNKKFPENKLILIREMKANLDQKMSDATIISFVNL